jgi:cytochrome b561
MQMKRPDAPYTRVLMPEQRQHDGLSMVLHWVNLLLMIVAFGTIWAREQVSDGNTAGLLLTLHRSAGALIWGVTLVRLGWKTAARSPALPSAMPRVQRWVARVNEAALYLLLIAQPVTGFLQSIARGKAFALLGLSIPAVMGRDKSAVGLFHAIHETSASVLLVLIGLHTCAALFHGLVLRDGVLRSMWPARE